MWVLSVTSKQEKNVTSLTYQVYKYKGKKTQEPLKHMHILLVGVKCRLICQRLVKLLICESTSRETGLCHPLTADDSISIYQTACVLT